MKIFTTKAWAKINLTLDILGRRTDGYHNLSSVMQTVSLYDAIEMEIVEQPGISLSVVGGSGFPVSDMPAEEENLAYKAAQSLISVYNIHQGVSIKLTKNIPIAAGLAGGSADCAAVINGMNELFNLKIPIEQLMKIGSKLGSDVPFCLTGGTARVDGLGERVEPLPAHPKTSLVLARLPILVSTKDIFSRWHGRSENQTNAMIKAVQSSDIGKIADNLANDLSPVVTNMHPEILELIAAFRKEKALGVNMSGSGPTVVAYYPTEADTLAAIKLIGKEFPDCEMFFCETLNLE